VEEKGQYLKLEGAAGSTSVVKAAFRTYTGEVTNKTESGRVLYRPKRPFPAKASSMGARGSAISTFSGMGKRQADPHKKKVPKAWRSGGFYRFHWNQRDRGERGKEYRVGGAHSQGRQQGGYTERGKKGHTSAKEK